MKIFLVSNMYPSYKHPVYGIFVKNFKNNLEELGVEFNAISIIRGRGKNVIIKIFKYIQLFLSVIYNGLFKKFDIIYVHYVNHSCIPVLFIKLIRPSCKIVLNVHGGDIFPENRLSKIFAIFSKYTFNCATLVVSPSNYYKDVLVSMFSLRYQDVFVSPSGGVDIRIFSSSESTKALNSSKIFGYISRIDKNKGWDVLLNAIVILKDKLNKTNFKVIIVGDGAQRNEMLQFIDSHGISNVIEYKGMLPQNELPDIIHSLDAFIFPTTRKAESLGLVGLEAMACGVPVIGSKNGGLLDYLTDGVNGYFFEPGNPEDLVDKIIQYNRLTDNEVYLMRKNAINTAKEFDNRKISEQLYLRLSSILINRDL
jgi:glycosyltransferase involved in cell wall biosynthesis